MGVPPKVYVIGVGMTKVRTKQKIMKETKKNEKKNVRCGHLDLLSTMHTHSTLNEEKRKKILQSRE